MHPLLIVDWLSDLCGMAGLGSDPMCRCGTGSLGQYRTPDMLWSKHAQRERVRSAFSRRILFKVVIMVKGAFLKHALVLMRNLKSDAVKFYFAYEYVNLFCELNNLLLF